MKKANAIISLKTPMFRVMYVLLQGTIQTIGFSHNLFDDKFKTLLENNNHLMMFSFLMTFFKPFPDPFKN